MQLVKLSNPKNTYNYNICENSTAETCSFCNLLLTDRTVLWHPCAFNNRPQTLNCQPACNFCNICTMFWCEKLMGPGGKLRPAWIAAWLGFPDTERSDSNSYISPNTSVFFIFISTHIFMFFIIS